ncbi:hypothetical protein [Iodobacter arcticus]|uniref:hypothetical protein n=1 Tax=Iodobacter arcticus TaxID=590593 RepID=UPI0036D29345
MPAEFLPEQCPPSDARQDNLKVFRLVANCPPNANDFLPTKVESPHRKFTIDELCMACGVSVFKNVADILKKRERFKPLKSKKIACGTISPSDGLVKETGQPSHVTWWLQTNEPHATFREVPDVTQ